MSGRHVVVRDVLLTEHEQDGLRAREQKKLLEKEEAARRYEEPEFLRGLTTNSGHPAARPSFGESLVRWQLSWWWPYWFMLNRRPR